MGDWVALGEYARKNGVSDDVVWSHVRSGRLQCRQAAGTTYVWSRADSADRHTAVPMRYAERSMATILQLHDELMAEKERCIDLHRRLMSREQVIAEFEAYVRILEAKAEGRELEARRPPRLATVTPIRPGRTLDGASPPQIAANAARPEGWRAW